MLGSKPFALRNWFRKLRLHPFFIVKRFVYRHLLQLRLHLFFLQLMFLLPLVISLVPVVGGKARFYNIGAYLHQIIPEVLLFLRCLVCPALLVVPPVLRVGHGSLMLRRLEAVLALQRAQQPREARSGFSWYMVRALSRRP